MAQVGLAGPFEYDEGNWIPALSFGGASVGITYATQEGYYIRTGNMVFATCNIELTSKGVSVGNAVISGLPFRVINDLSGYSAISAYFNAVNYTGQFQGLAFMNTFELRFYYLLEAGAIANLTNANLANNSRMVITVFYRTG